MTGQDLVADTFSKLKGVLERYADRLVLVADTGDNYYLDTPHVMKNKKPLFFVSVKKAKGHVSFHLMPVYLYPELLESASPELKRRMQGKSCFNFKSVETAALRDIEKLTRAGFERYKAEKYL